MKSKQQHGEPTAAEVAELYQQHFQLLKTIVVKNNYGRVCARAGWTINLIVDQGEVLAMRERAWQVVDFFVGAVGASNLVLWWGGRPAALTSKTAQSLIERYKPRTLQNCKTFAMSFFLASGNPKPPEDWENNAQDFYFKAYLANENETWSKDRHETPGIGRGMSYIRIALPVSWIEANPGDRGVSWFTNEVVRLINPYWATAGWGVVPAVEERNISALNQGQQALYPYLQRFPGLEAMETWQLASTAFNQAMCSINWVNYVSDPLLERLGGREAVLQQAQGSPLLGLAEVGNCLMIRAGGFPLLGDTETGLSMPGHGAAARLLKPIRVREMRNNFLGAPPRGSDDEASHRLDCDAYLSRFDRY